MVDARNTIMNKVEIPSAVRNTIVCLAKLKKKLIDPGEIALKTAYCLCRDPKIHCQQLW